MTCPSFRYRTCQALARSWKLSAVGLIGSVAADVAHCPAFLVCLIACQVLQVLASLVARFSAGATVVSRPSHLLSRHQLLRQSQHRISR